MNIQNLGSLALRLAIPAMIAAIVLSEAACYDPNAQQSRIVREVEAAGSGNISTYTLPGLVQWFSHRPDLATRVANECRPIESVAGANWGTSAEGSVCYAASKMVPPAPMIADQRTW